MIATVVLAAVLMPWLFWALTAPALDEAVQIGIIGAIVLYAFGIIMVLVLQKKHADRAYDLVRVIAPPGAAMAVLAIMIHGIARHIRH